mgnify:CR=1 FL=1
MKNKNDDRKNVLETSGILSFTQDALFAEIIIPLALPMNYTWSIPEEFAKVAMPGMRVEVSLKNKRLEGQRESMFPENAQSFASIQKKSTSCETDAFDID